MGAEHYKIRHEMLEAIQDVITYKMARGGVGRWLRMDRMLAMQAECPEFRANSCKSWEGMVVPIKKHLGGRDWGSSGLPD